MEMELSPCVLLVIGLLMLLLCMSMNRGRREKFEDVIPSCSNYKCHDYMNYSGNYNKEIDQCVYTKSFQDSKELDDDFSFNDKNNNVKYCPKEFYVNHDNNTCVIEIKPECNKEEFSNIEHFGDVTCSQGGDKGRYDIVTANGRTCTLGKDYYNGKLISNGVYYGDGTCGNFTVNQYNNANPPPPTTSSDTNMNINWRRRTINGKYQWCPDYPSMGWNFQTINGTNVCVKDTSPGPSCKLTPSPGVKYTKSDFCKSATNNATGNSFKNVCVYRN